jgi:hypothetical protein
MKKSLQRQLSIGLSIAIICTGLLAALAAFFLSLNEAQEYQDASLQQIAALVPPQVWQNAYRYDQRHVDIDPDARIVVEPLCLSNCGKLDRPLQLPRNYHRDFIQLLSKIRTGGFLYGGWDQIRRWPSRNLPTCAVMRLLPVRV